MRDPQILGDAFKLVLAAMPKNHGEMLHLHEDICGDDIEKYELLLNVCCDHCPFRKMKRPEVVSALAIFLATSPRRGGMLRRQRFVTPICGCGELGFEPLSANNVGTQH